MKYNHDTNMLSLLSTPCICSFIFLLLAKSINALDDEFAKIFLVNLERLLSVYLAAKVSYRTKSSLFFRSHSTGPAITLTWRK